MKRNYSLEGLIVSSTALVFLVVGFFLVVAIRQNANTAADEAYDRVLEAAALSIADTVSFVDGEVTVDIPYSAFAILGSSRLTRIFYRVASPDGDIVTGDPVLGLEMAPAFGPDIRFLDSVMQDEPIRLAAVGRYRSDATTGEAGWINVFVGETREARDQLSAQLTTNAIAPAVAIAFCAFGIIWVGIRAAFSPLRSIERDLSRRTPSNLEPISENLPREVATLARTLNQLLNRLSSTLDGLRRVTADAAHQFRTPLAAMRAQAELALEEDNPVAVKNRLRRIHDNAVTTSTLATRLLSEATLLHSIKSGQTQRLDLAGLTKDVIEKTTADIGDDEPPTIPFERPRGAVWIDAEPASLSEAIRNVIENAFLYGGGPTSLILARTKTRAVLEIIDAGPGIPRDRRHIVFERFERNSNQEGGTGLGLAIAHDVVTSLGGDIILTDAPKGGLRVGISLPLSRVPENSGKAWHRRTPSIVAATLLAAQLFAIEPTQAQDTFAITAPFSQQRFEPVMDALSARFSQVNFSYQQARSAQVAARLTARAPLEVDLVIMAAPDIATAITNEGLVANLGIEPLDMQSGAESSWRGELFAVAFDPAVILVANPAPGSFAMSPNSRLELAQALESTPQLFRRAGIVNIGTDAVSYALAAQDSLRSPLYWRLAAAFGSAQARIYDTSAELVDALEDGDIDIGYNVPLSEVGGAASEAYDVIVPQDYALGLPWTLFVPETSTSTIGAAVAQFLLSREGQSAVSQVLWRNLPQRTLEIEEQRITLGPELLVYLDSIKRSNFLDAWFELVTSP